MYSFGVQFLEFFVFFGDQTSVGCGVNEDLFPFCRLSFCLVDHVLCFTDAFQFQEVPFVNCFSQCLCYWGYIYEVVPVPMRSTVLSTFSSIMFSVAGFMLRSLIHLNLRFVHGDRYGSIFILLHVDI